jgi:hypothetical protein
MNADETISFWVTQFTLWHETNGDIDKSRPPAARYSGLVTVPLIDIPTSYEPAEFALEWLECQVRGLLDEQGQDGNYGIAAYRQITPAPALAQVETT